MSSDDIPNQSLKLSDIPAVDAPFEVVRRFGYTFNGYKQLGSSEVCAEIANEKRHGSLTELRACLFFEQRRWHHYGEEPGAEAQAYQRKLVEHIRAKLETNDRA